MAIMHKILNCDGYLKVIASGIDDNLIEVQEYAQAVIEAAHKYQSINILCDERSLTYNLSTFDTFELANFASQYAKFCRKIAIVCNPDCLESGKFYETVSQNRGLIVKVFTELSEAEEWLK
jgi:hypothetical protein